MAQNIPSRDYNEYLGLIKQANRDKDLAMLKEVKRTMILKYGLENPDVKYLIKQFQYSV